MDRLNKQKVEIDAEASIVRMSQMISESHMQVLRETYLKGYDQAMRDYRVGVYTDKNEVNRT